MWRDNLRVLKDVLLEEVSPQLRLGGDASSANRGEGIRTIQEKVHAKV